MTENQQQEQELSTQAAPKDPQAPKVSAPKPEIVKWKRLGDIVIKIIKSRKTAIPDGVPGSHFIVGIFATGDDKERDFNQVSDEQDAAAYLYAKSFAKEISKKPEFGSSGIYRVVQNSEDAATRKNYHLHVIVLGITLAEAEAQGFEIRRLIDPDSFLIKKTVIETAILAAAGV